MFWSVETKAPVEAVYGYWQAFENLSRFEVKVAGLLTEDQELSHRTLHGAYGLGQRPYRQDC